MSRPGVALRSVAGLIETAGALGFEKAPLWSLLGGEVASWPPDALVPRELVYDVWEHLLATSGDGDLAMRIASLRLSPPADPFGFVIMTSPSVQDALEMALRYLHLRATTLRWRFVRVDAAQLKLVQDRPGEDRPGRRLAVEATTAELVLRMREHVEGGFQPFLVTFGHAPLGTGQPHRAVFGAPVEFSAREDAVWFSSALLSATLRRGDPALSAYFREQVEAALAQRGEPRDDLLSLLRRLLARDLARVPSLEEAARALGLGARTLRRRLDDAGTSFQEALDALRAEVARQHLGRPRLPIAEVAYLLGYSEPSAFHRAFKRWTGETPAQFRERALAPRKPPSSTPSEAEKPE